VDEKNILTRSGKINVAIISAYNDMLSAHKPYENYPPLLREYFLKLGASCQVAGGVPAMCDGVTQGKPGMELSLFSRDLIAMSTSVSLSHNAFNGILGLAICDKIVPGLLMGALKFGYLPFIFIPAGPMPSGISNAEKSKVRQQYADGKVNEDDLLKVETAAYHSPGTCTFYGTANTNQLLMEVMGLMLPGSAFVNPGDVLRSAYNEAACQQLTQLAQQGSYRAPLAEVVCEESIVNGIIALLASGGSTNHTIHLVAIAQQAGIKIDWQDFQQLSAVVPLVARIYPNGEADINAFHQAGGTAFFIHTLLEAGLLHADVKTVFGQGLETYTRASALDKDKLKWKEAVSSSKDDSVLVSHDVAFRKNGGLMLLQGNLGRAIVKTSAMSDEHFTLQAPCKVFESQDGLSDAFKAGELNHDFIAVVRYQGAKANGMPELHQLTPLLCVLQKRGYKVALVTDGRMSGASGAVPAAIHLYPEAQAGGLIAKIKDGDQLIFSCATGELRLLVDEDELQSRSLEGKSGENVGLGREMFEIFRKNVTNPELGATVLSDY